MKDVSRDCRKLDFKKNMPLDSCVRDVREMLKKRQEKKKDTEEYLSEDVSTWVLCTEVQG